MWIPKPAWNRGSSAEPVLKSARWKKWPDSEEPEDIGARWVRTDGLRRFPMVNVAGTWRWLHRGRGGTEEDLVESAMGRYMRRWRLVQHSRDAATLLMEFGPKKTQQEVARNIGAGWELEGSPLFKFLWADYNKGAGLGMKNKKIAEGHTYNGEDAQRRNANKDRNERALMHIHKNTNSCVYLSLYHLSTKELSRDLLVHNAKDWGPLRDMDSVKKMAAEWARAEGANVEIYEARTDKPTSTTGCLDCVARLIVDQGANHRKVALVITANNKGGAHCSPVEGDILETDFCVDKRFCFHGRVFEAELIAVEQAAKTAKKRETYAEKASANMYVALESADGSSSTSGLIEVKADATAAGIEACEDLGLIDTTPKTKDEKKAEQKPKKDKGVAKEKGVVDPTAPAAPVKVAKAEEKKPDEKVEPKTPVPVHATVQCQLVNEGVACEVTDDHFEEPEPEVSYGGAFGHVKMVYEGPVNQLSCETAWRSGWWRFPGTEFGCADFFDRWAVAPDIAAATIEMAREWGTRCYYSKIRATGGLRMTRDGEVTDGTHKAQTFKEGSVITVRWSEYMAVPAHIRVNGVVIEVLKLVRTTSGSLVSTVGVWSRIWGKAKLKSYAPKVDWRLDENLTRTMKWQAEAKTAKDPVVTGFVNLLRGNMDKEAPMDPDGVMPFVNALSECYTKPRDVGGPFEWGYCYGGCSKPRPGCFKGRICLECNAKNTELGEWVANNHRICTMQVPIRYPGVVNSKRKHPSLKKSAKSCAIYGEDLGLYGTDGALIPFDAAMAIPLRDTAGPRLGGVGIDGAAPFVTAPGARPLLEAVMYRVFKDLGPDRKVDKECFAMADRMADLLLPHFVVPDAVPMEVREWLDSMTVARRKKALFKAWDDLRKRGGEKSQEWGTIKPFVKSENLPNIKARNEGMYNAEFDGGCAEYVARLIQAPSDESHLDAGPWLKPLIGRLKADWNWQNWIFYASVSPAKLDKWLARIHGARSWFWSDYTAFDATYSDAAWDTIEGIYARAYPHAPKQFWDTLRMWRRPKGRVRLFKDEVTLKYQARTCNCSGRDDTALANALLNGLVLALSFAAALEGIDITQLEEKHIRRASEMVDIGIVGDDSLVACKFDVELIKDAVESNIKRFGLVAKVETSPHLWDVTFLGQMPYPNDQGFQWGPTIGRRLYKAFWQMEPDGSLPSWTRGVAQQLKMCRNVPILHEIASRVDELLYSHKVTKPKLDEHRLWATRTEEAAPWNIKTLEWMSRRYEKAGVTVWMLIHDLETVSNITRLPAVVRLESVERILTVDDL